MRSSPPKAELEALAGLLRHRLHVIADTVWRDRDPTGHLDALREVSEKIMTWHEARRGGLPPRLEHFLTSCSYEKALALIENELIS